VTEDRRLRAEALFAAHGRAVLAYARRRASSTVADEVLSDVFVVAWRRLDDLPQDPRPWLLACARSSLANHRRAERRRLRLIERLATVVPAQAVCVSDGGLMAAALASIKEGDREALLLTAWEGLSAAQAAAVLGCSPEAFRKRSERARRRLASALQSSGDDATPLAREVLE
jgi:RNA polymerase sigma-70 factor (ECF subfamily)